MRGANAFRRAGFDFAALDELGQQIGDRVGEVRRRWSVRRLAITRSMRGANGGITDLVEQRHIFQREPEASTNCMTKSRSSSGISVSGWARLREICRGSESAAAMNGTLARELNNIQVENEYCFISVMSSRIGEGDSSSKCECIFRINASAQRRDIASESPLARICTPMQEDDVEGREPHQHRGAGFTQQQRCGARPAVAGCRPPRR